MKRLFYLFTLILLFLSTQVQATTLGDTAAKLSAGQWVKMLDGTGVGQMGNLNATASYPAWDNNSSDNPGVNGSASPGPAYDGGQPGWNSATRKMYFQTTEHGRAGVPNWCPAYWPLYPHGCWKPTWTYDTDTNNWDVGRSGQTITGVFPKDNSGNPLAGVHVWGGITWDDVNQVLYVKEQETFSIRVARFCAPTATVSYCAGQLGQWKLLPTFNFPASELLGQALGYHRTLNGGTLLVWEQSGAGTGCAALAGYKEGTTGTNGVWTLMNSGSGCAFPTAAGAPLLETQYSTLKQVAVLSSGTNKMWRVTNTGAIQALDNAPCNVGTTNGNFATAAEDQSTGEIYYLMCDGAPAIWKLNPTGAIGAQWTPIATTAQLTATGALCQGDTACIWKIYATPIRTYGVIGFWKWKQLGLAEYWLFKPSTGSVDIVAPTVSITAPTAGATVTGAAVTVSATASDNVGVVGVQFKLDGANLGTEDTASPFSITWNSTGASNGSHTITATARDLAGNSTTSTGVSVTVSNVGGSDFATRCAGPGVLRCIGFDNATDIANTVFGAISGINTQGTAIPTLDSTVKASGNSSLKLTVPSLSSANSSGHYWINFSDNLLTQYRGNADFYVQFRYRGTSCWFFSGSGEPCTGAPRHFAGGGGWKIAHVGSGDQPGCTTSNSANCKSSCSDLELVPQNTQQRGFPHTYQGCPSSTPDNPYTATNDSGGINSDVDLGGGSDFNLQNGRPSPFCLYSQNSSGTTPLNYFPPIGNCFGFFPDEWMTFKIRITTGTLTANANGHDYFLNSRVRMWMAREGQPSQLVIDWQNVPLHGGVTGANEGFGKIWLNNYNTGKDDTVSNPASAVWYDELIVSTNDIPDPGAPPDTTNPTVAITSPIPPTTSSTTSPITVSGTAADNVSVTSVTWTCIQCVTKGGTATSSPGASISWLIPALDLVAGTNTLNVVAHDAAGNPSTAATLTITYTPVTTRYASTTGGGTACTVITTPCTLTVALGQLLASETLFLRAGTYTTYLNGDTFNWPSGTPSAKTTIAGYPVEVVIIRPVASESIINMSTSTFGAKSYIKFQNLILDGGAMNSGTQVIGSNGAQTNIEFDHITIQNNPDNNAWSVCATCNNWWIHDSQIINLKGGYGIYNTASGTMFEHNTISGGDSWAIHNYNSGHNDVSNNTYRYNTITNQGQSALYSGAAVLASGSNNAFYGNLVYNNLRAGLVLQDCTDCAVYNNTIYGNGSVAGASGLLIGDAGATPTRPIVRNNIIAASAGANVTLNGATSPTNDHNLCDVAGTWCDTVQAATAIFINPATANFRLNTGSSALNTGATLAAPYDTDILGLHRPQGTFFDLGAYELNAAIIQPVVTIVNPTAATKLIVQAPLFSLGGTSNLP